MKSVLVIVCISSGKALSTKTKPFILLFTLDIASLLHVLCASFLLRNSKRNSLTVERAPSSLLITNLVNRRQIAQTGHNVGSMNCNFFGYIH